MPYINIAYYVETNNSRIGLSEKAKYIEFLEKTGAIIITLEYTKIS